MGNGKSEHQYFRNQLTKMDQMDEFNLGKAMSVF